MTLDDYQLLAQKVSQDDGHNRILSGVTGLKEAAGKCDDLVKNALFHDQELNKAELVDELGNALWCIAEAAAGIERQLDLVAARNIGKLHALYPERLDVDTIRRHLN